MLACSDALDLSTEGTLSKSTLVRLSVSVQLLLILGTAASNVTAEDPGYTYLEGGWVRDDPDEGDSENGWFGGGSFGVEWFHFFGEYRDPGAFETFEAGGGWHGLLGEKADLVAEAAYVDADFDEGYRASGGVRWLITDDFEVNAWLNHTDVGDFENDTLALGAHWEFWRSMAVGGEYEFGDEADSARIFIRFYFRRHT